jgi:cystathionine beta-synthase
MRENQYLESPVRLTTGDVLMNKGREHRGMISVSTDCTIGEAIELMRRHGISQLPVIRDMSIAGSLDETRLLNVLLSDTEAWNHNVQQFMDAPFPIVAEDAPVESLTTILQDKVQALIIQRRNGDRDIVTKSDLIFTLLKAEKAITAR